MLLGDSLASLRGYELSLATIVVVQGHRDSFLGPQSLGGDVWRSADAENISIAQCVRLRSKVGILHGRK